MTTEFWTLYKVLSVLKWLGPCLELILFLVGLSGIGVIFYLGKNPVRAQKVGRLYLGVSVLMLLGGFLTLCYLHLSIYHTVVLKLPPDLAHLVNQWLLGMGKNYAFQLPLYHPSQPPRFAPPPWLGDEKYLFWFLIYSLLAYWAWPKLSKNFFRYGLLFFSVLHLLLLPLFFHPLSNPLPEFLAEISPWWAPLSAHQRIIVFLKLYPRLIFYYNAPYMWVHPPLLLIAYATLELFFVFCLGMFMYEDLQIEKLAYFTARPGYLALTLGMLVGLPWALEAWGSNW